MEFCYNPEKAQTRWRNRSRFNYPILITRSCEERIRNSPMGDGGFPEGHLYLFQHDVKGSPSELAVSQFQVGGPHSNRVVRVAKQVPGVIVIPYAVLPFLPPQERIGAFVGFSKFESTSLYWIDQLMLFLPKEIKLFIEEETKEKESIDKEISGLVRRVERFDEPLATFVAKKKYRLTKIIKNEDAGEGDWLDRYIERRLQSAQQPPIFNYLFSSFYNLQNSPSRIANINEFHLYRKGEIIQ